ncbi:hypothetical protein [Gracilimonas mengyeensis]|uniref:Uncharacterized protein n=1 Tax=Gracilimonas mengyeensis TaxID=1302730 RepID=A0A521FLE8_9BACT|nr:hypothetical protein [Gracilimonas mengyeensis]SMO97053.1 hypothetical protein SAMN06265219_12227 [Gracilimonas mengyeensis]
MENFQRGRSKWQMLELSDGITTSNGNWYRITAEGIEEYIPGLLDKYPLEQIIEEADAWVKSADGLSLMLFFILVLVSLNPLLATLISLAFYLFWFFNTSAFVNIPSNPIVKFLSKDGVVYTISAIVLIGISLNDIMESLQLPVSFEAIWYGLVLIFLYKVGLLRLLIQFIQKKTSGDSGPSREDRVLNMLLIRYGMKEGKLTGEVEDMEDELIRIKNYHKSKKKK